LANIVTSNSYKYVVEFFNPANVLPIPNGGTLYGVINSPFTTVTIENPNNNTNHLRVTQNRGGSDTTFDYAWISNGWRLTNGSGLRIETRTETLSETNTLKTVTNLIQQGSSAPVFHSVRKYRISSNNIERLIVEVIGTGANAISNSYTYTAGGDLQQVVRSDGSWEYFLYDSSNRPTNIFSGFKNQGVTTNKADCRLIEHTYTTNVISGAGDTGYLETTTPRQTVEYLLGQEIGRTYFVALPGERRRIQCVATNAPWNNASNLVTVTKLFTNSFYFNTPKSVLRPDGTIEIFQYGAVAISANAYRTNLVLTGHPDASGTNIDAGATNIFVFDPLGQLLSKTVIDEVSSITIAGETNKYDGLKRLTNTTYLDGTSVQTSYDCCTASSVTDRDGTVINYTYDALKRLLTTTRAGITNANTYDAYGNVLSTVRYGTDGTAITNLISTFDDAARLTSSKDALNNLTTYTNYVDGSGQTVRKTTFPNNSTRIATYYKDGSLVTNNGTAIHGVHYDYGVESDGGTQRAYTKEIKLTTSDSDSSEWTKTYQDSLKRPFKTVFADNAYSQTFYNTNGQATKQVDPDGVTTLFQYSNQGELEYTVIDVNTNGTIDFAGSDRISRTVTAVTNNGAANVRRTTTSAWYTTNDAATIVSVAEVSVDGLRRWNSAFGLTNSTWTLYSGGHKYVTNTVPDGSFQISDYQYGRLLSVTRKDSGGNQIGATTNGYEAHGRLGTVADARTGAVTNGYDNADRVTSVTTPSPNVQTTTTKYNNMGWVTNVVLPDNGSVVSSYFLTGELATNSGARTYPVGYTYDYAGRLKTMTTWTNFANAAGTATTTWNYDAYRGFMTNKAYADGKGPSYTYKPSGRLATRVWARGTNTTYTYNIAGELATIVYNDGTTPNVTNTYDRRGRTIAVNQGANTTALAYNDAGQLLSETVNGLSATNSYDSLLRRTNLSAYAGSTLLSSTAYVYDNASRLASVVDGTNKTAYSYLANSPLVEKILLTNGSTLRLSTTKTYDSLNRLTSISNTPSADSAIAFNYAYNTANQRTGITNADSSRWSYGYDSLGQVTSGKKYWSDGTIVAGQQFEYAFDDIGNRKVAASGGDQWGSNLRYANYTVNNLNQYAQRTVPGNADVIGTATNTAIVTVNNQATYRKGDYFRVELAFDNQASAIYWGVTNVGVLNNGTNADIVTNITGNLFIPKTAETLTYDADGNLKNDGRWMLTWDTENRLLAMESHTNAPDGSKRKLEFGYDWRSRRVTKMAFTWSGSNYMAQSTNRFLYDDWNVIAILNTPSSNLVSSFVWGLDLSGSLQGAGGIGGFLAVNSTTGAVQFASYDGNGNVFSLINATNGVLSAIYEYGPFGELIREEGTKASVNRIRFSTKMQDEETDLSYYGYRYYSPINGRWLSYDRIRDDRAINLSSAFANNPITKSDYLGMWVAHTQPPGVDVITIVCKGGKAVPRLPPSINDNSQCVISCIRRHEQVHANAANAQRVCEGQPDGVAILASSGAERVASEIEAYKQELTCLNKFLPLADPADAKGNYPENCPCRKGNVTSLLNQVPRKLAGWQKANPEDPSTWPEK
jgi:RHS repeat-associated protein